MTTILIVLLTLLLSASNISAQEIFDTKVIELDDGLRERTVNKIQRDADGYFYIKTENYIQRWDGSSFEDIDASALESLRLLKSNTQLELLLDSTVILLETGKSGNDIYAIDASNLSIYKINPTWDPGDMILFSAGRLYNISHPNENSTSIAVLDTKFQSSVLASLDQYIKITSLAHLDDRLIFNDDELNVYSYIYGTQSLINQNKSGHLLSSPSANLVLANNDNIYHFQNGVFNKIKSINPQVSKNKQNVTIKPQKLVYLDYDSEGNIGIGYTDRDRRIQTLEIVDNEGKRTNLDMVCVPNDKIIDIYADDYTDKLLLATYNGIYFHQLSGRGIKTSMKKELSQKSKFGQIISAVEADQMGNVYFCNEGSGLFQYDSISNTGKVLINDKKHFVGNLKLYHDSLDNTLWANGYNNANTSDLYSYNLDTKRVKKYPLQFLANDFIKEDEDHFLLIGKQYFKKPNGKYGGKPKIARFNLKDNSLDYITLLDSTIHAGPRNLFPYKDYMLIGTTNGLLICDRSMTNILRVVDVKSTESDIALNADWIVFVKPFHDWLMVGTNGDGVFLMDPNTFECVGKVSGEDGLSDNVAVAMEIDPRGNAWITSFNGINIVDSNLNVIQTIYEHEGLSNREFSSFANITSNGSFYFGTNNGVSIIDPEAFLQRKSSKGLAIRNIELINKRGGITRHLSHERKLKLDEQINDIVLNVTFPDFFDYNIGNIASELSIESENEYSFKGEQLKLSDPKLGEYSIKISNILNNYEKEITLNVQRNYPWKQILLILIIILLSYLISRYFIKRNIAIEADKTQFNKKISELKLNALKAQMNPHFIFNALGAIQYFIQTQDTDKADEYLSKFAKLMRLILESSKNDYINIQDEMELMELYADLEYVRFEGLFDYVVDIADDVDTDMALPPMIVQPLVENAINHGLYNLKGRKGLLEILTTTTNEDEIKIVIRDNGVGRGYKSQSKKPNHKSRGMDILKERISIINSSNEMHVDLHIHDLDQIGKGNGTEVVIKIKYFN